MSDLVADTHAVVWYLLDSPDLSAAATAAMDSALQGGETIFVASISVVEVTYLVEKGRLPVAALDSLEQALVAPGSGLALAVLDLAVARALRRVRRDLVPDMPDRIVTATALALNLPLVTADRMIRASGVTPTVW